MKIRFGLGRLASSVVSQFKERPCAVPYARFDGVYLFAIIMVPRARCSLILAATSHLFAAYSK